MENFVRINRGTISLDYLQGVTLDKLVNDFPESDKEELTAAWTKHHKDECSTISVESPKNQRKSSKLG